MVLISKVEESGDVKAQLRHILKEEEHQTHTTQTAQRKDDRLGEKKIILFNIHIGFSENYIHYL